MIVDSYAWIELINGTEKGEKVKNYLKNVVCYTAITSLSEIVDSCLKSGKDPYFPILTIFSTSKTLFLDKQIALTAGRVNFERKKKIKGWGMMDSFILAFSLNKKVKILTGDKHFSDLQNVEML